MNGLLDAARANLAVRSLACGDTYGGRDGVYDEMRSETGAIRPHWDAFLTAVNALGCDEIQRRHNEALHLLRENGSTYNIHGEGDPDGWKDRLNPIPYILSTEDWKQIEAGAAQRARLLDGVFADLYGEGSLLMDGLLPPELVYGHRGFLAPCHFSAGERRPRTVFFAIDMARDASGTLRVLRHHAQSPDGMGYAVEGRTIMARVFPELIRDCRVYRLSHFFRALRDSLADLTPGRTKDPRIVLLTPGPHASNYFEHVYLSAYLGYPLVHGDDLTVRDASVWLKSIDGLERIDIIVRFMDDALCDPLELSSQAKGGIPGLTEAVRQGNVTVANPLGAGFLDNDGLQAFLPDLCRSLLGEDLLLPGPASWWCGSPESLDHVLKNLDRLDVVEIDGGRRLPPMGRGGSSSMSAKEREALRRRILAAPYRFAASELPALATSPSFERDTLVSNEFAFRVFVCEHGGKVLVMPGGIAHQGGQSPEAGAKDVWVLAPEPQKHASLWLQPGRIEESLRSSSILTSRAAENLFWVGRYAERAEGLARLLRTVFQQTFQSTRFDDHSEMDCLQCLLVGLTHLTNSYPGFTGEGARVRLAAPEKELAALVADFGRAGSLVSSLRYMIRAAYAVRERWSKDTWRVLDEIDARTGELSRVEPGTLRSSEHELDRLVTSLAAFAGLCMESMIREQGWLILDVGRRIERSLHFVDLLRFVLVERHDADTVREHLVLESILVTTENIIAYRRRYRSTLRIETVLEMLLLDDMNPRSLAYQLSRLQQHVAKLPRDHVGYRMSDEERAILEASSLVRLSDPAQLVERTGKTRLENLDWMLGKVCDLLSAASDILSKTYFAHVQESQQLGVATTIERKL